MHYDNELMDIMSKQFFLRRRKLFDELYKLNFEVETKEQLDNILKIFEKDLRRFETLNSTHQSRGGIYLDENYYSFDKFQFLVGLTITIADNRDKKCMIDFYKITLPRKINENGDFVLIDKPS